MRINTAARTVGEALAELWKVCPGLRDRVGRVRGKVLGIFNTQDGHTLADVEWNTLGPPRRLNISNLTKI